MSSGCQAIFIFHCARSSPTTHTSACCQMHLLGFQVESYLRYQGHKFFKRFDAASYVAVTKMMDTHDVGRGMLGWCC